MSDTVINPGAVCNLHRELFLKLTAGDSVLTLNYDLVADQALFDIEPQEHGRPVLSSRLGKLTGMLYPQSLLGGTQPPALLKREREGGFYLKLHGSLDWLYCPHPGCPNNISLFPVGLSSLAEDQTEGQPCRYCGAPLRVFIVPPVPSKRIEDRGRLSFLWHLAFRELCDATRLVLIGVSFNPIDADLRWLVRQSMDAHNNPIAIEIVNQNLDHREDTARLLGSNVHNVQHYDNVACYLASNPVV